MPISEIQSSLNTIACSAANTTRNLTQPTELAADWAGIHYTKPHLRPRGIPIGAFCVNRTGPRSERPSYIGGTKFTTTQPQIMTISNGVEVLTSFRQEWEQFADGESLVDVKGSVGLMIFDLVRVFLL